MSPTAPLILPSSSTAAMRARARLQAGPRWPFPCSRWWASPAGRGSWLIIGTPAWVMGEVPQLGDDLVENRAAAPCSRASRHQRVGQVVDIFRGAGEVDELLTFTTSALVLVSGP